MPLDPSVLAPEPSASPAVARQRTKVSGNLDALLEAEGASHLAPVVNAIYGQESGHGSNSQTSTDGARGPMQIMPGTFKQLARQGESIDNPEDNMRVGIRLIKALGDKFKDDPARIAAGYFSGEGNVNPTGDQILRRDPHDGNGKRVSSYVQDVLGRIDGKGVDGTALAKQIAAGSGIDLAKQIAAGSSGSSSGIDLAKQIAAGGMPEAEPVAPAAPAAEPTLGDKVKNLAEFGVETTQDIGRRLLEPFKRDKIPGSVTNEGVPDAPRDLKETGGVPLQAERLQQFRTIARDQPKTAAKIAQRDDWSGQAMRAVLEEQGIQVERIKAGDNMTAPNARDIAQRATMRPAPELTAGGEDNAKIAYNQKGDIGKNLAHVTQGVQQGVLDVRDGVIGAGQFALRLAGAEDVADELQKHQVDLKARAGNLDLPSTAGYGAKTAQAVARSLTMNVPGLLTGATAPALTAMGIQSFGQEFGTGKQAGMNDAEATVRAGIFSAAEVLGERFGLGDTLKGLKAAANGMPTSELVNHFGRAMVKEIPGEELTSTLQFLADKYLPQGLHQNATFDDYLRLTADTLVQTVLQSGVMMGGGAAVSKTVQAIDAKFPNATLGRAMREAVEGGQFSPEAVDRAARLALDPNANSNTAVLPESRGFVQQPPVAAEPPAPEQPASPTGSTADALAALEGTEPAPAPAPAAEQPVSHTPASLEFLMKAHPDQVVRDQAAQALAQPRSYSVVTETDEGPVESKVAEELKGVISDTTVQALQRADGGRALSFSTPEAVRVFDVAEPGANRQVGAVGFSRIIEGISGRKVIIVQGAGFRGAVVDGNNVFLSQQQDREGLTTTAFHELRHALADDHHDLSAFWRDAVRQHMDTSDSALLSFLSRNYNDAAFSPAEVKRLRAKGRTDSQILNALLAKHETATRYEDSGRGSRRDWALEELEADALGDAANRNGVIHKALDYMAKVDIGMVKQFSEFVRGALQKIDKAFGQGMRSEGFVIGADEQAIRNHLAALDKAASEVLGKYASRTQNQKRMQSATVPELLMIKKSHPDDVVRDMASAQLKEREKEAAYQQREKDNKDKFVAANKQARLDQAEAEAKAAGTDDGTPTAMQNALAKAKPDKQAARQQIAKEMKKAAATARGAAQVRADQLDDNEAGRFSPARGETAADHKMHITREDRELADKTKLSRDELKRVTAAAMQFSLKPKLVELEVRRIKARFPESAGWAPLEFLRVDTKTMAKKAKESNPLPSEAVFFVEQGYKFHTDKTGKDNPKTHDERVTQLASALAGEITGKYVAAQNGDPIAKVIMRQADWYQALRGKLRTTFGGFGDFLAQLLGPTSANNPVEPNFKYGIEALKLATSGKWDSLFRDIFTWRADIQAAAANLDDVIARVKDEGGKGVMKDPRVLLAIEELKKASVYKGEMPLRENGKQFGMATAGIQQILADAWGDKQHGDAPKTKNYYQNIMGRTTGATIDVWAARTLRRLANEAVGDFPRIPPVAESAVAGQVLVDGVTSGSEFGFGQEVFEKAAEQLRNAGIDLFKNTTPDAVQAMIWFAEKELWARRDWTTKVGEEGSIEHEMLLAGYPDRAQVDAWRVAARAGHPNPEAKAYQGKNGELRKEKFEKDVAQWKEAKRIGAEELARIERYPDRYVAGVTTEIPDIKPSDKELADVAREVEAAISDDKVMAMRAQTSTGEFMGDFERTLDVEFVARNDYNAMPVWNKLVEIGQREGQQAVFLSRVLREDEVSDPLKHRPGVELYFAKPITLKQAQPLMDMINAAGVHGMTMATEGRRTPSAMAGEDQPIAGIRMQHIPEFSLGYGYNVSMTNAEIEASVRAAYDQMNDLVHELDKRADVSTAKAHWYETRVHFYGNQNLLAEGSTGRESRKGDREVWSGQRISEALESADRFARDGEAPLAARRAELGQLPRRGAEAARLSPGRSEEVADQWRAVRAVWLQIADQPAAFKFPKSDATDLAGIFKEIDPRIRVSQRGVMGDMANKGIKERYVVFLPTGKDVEVYVKGNGRMWVNASQLKASTGSGTKVYQGLLNYAYNTDKVLVGDPLGVSDLATFRRTEQMLSAALKFGTTDFMEPSNTQATPKLFKDSLGHHNGVIEKFADLKWEPGNDSANLASLLRVSYTNIRTLLPEIDHVEYNFERDTFEHTGTAREVTPAEWQAMSQRLAAALRGDRGVGGATDTMPPELLSYPDRSVTLQRGVLTGTVLRRAGSDRGRPVLDRGIGKLRELRTGRGGHPLPGDSTGSAERDRAGPEDQVGARTPLYQILYSPARFYSQLGRAFEQAPDRVFGPASQVKAWLASNAGKLGVKQDEIQWTGINDWLDLQGKQKVTKADVLSYLQQNGVQVDEVEKREGFDENNPQLPEGSPLQVVETDAEYHGAMARRYGYAVLDTESDTVKGYGNTEQEAIADAYGGHPGYWEDGDETKYGGYTLPGGENYRELLLTLPEKHVYPKTPALTQEEQKDFQYLTLAMRRNGNLLPPEMAEWKRLKKQRDAYDNELEDISRAGGNKQPFRSSHWSEDNILAHVRFNDRTDAEGNKVLFIEELQSDWGQNGKKQGFNTGRKAVAQVRNGEWGILDQRGDFWRSANREEAERLAAGSLEVKVPAAPFVTDTKAWLGLGIKRMIAYAVEHGYDKVAFASGEQSADRYDLSKHIDTFDYAKEKNGTYVIQAKKDGAQKVQKREQTLEDIEALVGKEIAEKVARNEGEPFSGSIFEGHRRLSGLDLKVGGEGMKTFYDKIVPQTTADVLKKLGGGKLEKLTVATRDSVRGNEEYTYGISSSVENDDYYVADTSKNWENVAGPFATHKEAHAWLQANDPVLRTEQTGFTITPELKAKVSEGMPLFSPRRTTSGVQTWDSPDATRFEAVLYELQDKHIDTKKVRAAIKAAGRPVEDRFDPYLLEETYHGRAGSRTQLFLEQEVEPLLESMRQHNVNKADFERYLHARHAKERNAAMKAINPSMQDNEALSGMTDAEAQQILAASPPVFGSIAKRVDAIIKQTQDELMGYSLESPATIAAWNGAYKHYVPLFRDLGEVDPPNGHSPGQGFSVRGAASQRATGSDKPVENILAHIVMQREQAITRGEKNRVTMGLYGMVLQNPNGGFWNVVHPNKMPAALQTEMQALGIDPAVIQTLVATPKVRTVDERTGLVVERPNPLYRSMPEALVLRVNGEDRVILFSKKDARAMRMAEALKNLDIDQVHGVLGTLERYIGKGTRYISAINTQYNPIFGFVNFARDIQGAMFNLTTTGIAGQQGAVFSQALSAMRGIWLLERGHAGNNAWSSLYKEFLLEGGATGYRDAFANANDRAEALERVLNPGWHQSIKPLNMVLDLLSDYNTAVENSIRLSAYKAARDKGLSKEQSASISKNITVNFNRKGRSGARFNNYFAFFNAAVQGTARMGEVMTGPKGKAILASGIALGMLQAIVGMAAFGEDGWEDIPEFERARNLILPTFNDKKYIKIPMPLGLHTLPNLGRALVEASVYRDKPGKRLINLFGSLLDAFNPVGGGPLLQQITPTVVDPLVQLATNRSAFDRQIAKEDRSDLAPTPGHTRYKEGASTLSKKISEGINYATLGTEYKPGIWSPTPDQLDFIFGTLTGGLGRELNKAYTAYDLKSRGEEVPLHKQVLLGRFYGEADDKAAIRTHFYENVKELSAHELEIKGRAKDGKDYQAYLKEEPTAHLFGLADGTSAAVNKLTKYRQVVSDPERRKDVDNQILDLMKRLNDQVAVAKKEAGQ